MKKCPKCGTVLDDSKKKCYMCGADLTKPVMDVNNAPQNKPVEKPASNDNAEVVVNKGAGYNAAMNTNIYNNNELNSMNSMQYDERSKLEKIFAGQNELKSKDEINAEKNHNGKKNNKKNKVKKVPKKKVVETKPNQQEQQISNQPAPQMPNQLGPQIPNSEQAINWGDNLPANNNKNNNVQKPLPKKVNFRLIFNIVCSLLFVGCIIFVIVLLVNKNSDKDKDIDLFGGLSYKIDSSFTLKTKESNRRHYTMGDNCSISISYGPTNDKDGFIDNYFESIKNSYEKQEGFTTQKTDLTIQGNQWSEISIIELRKTGESDISYATYTRYKYISIVNKGNFYTIMFANTDDNAECSAKYDKMIDSLNFE